MVLASQQPACPPLQSLAAFLSGNLPEGEFAVIDSHLETCRRCQALIADGSEAADSLDGCLKTISNVDTTTYLVQPLELGTFDQYQLTGILGGGGMGVVYRARHLYLGHAVALKCLSPARDQDTESQARFLKEIQAAAALHHANIVRVDHAGQAADGRMFLVMEILEGKNFSELVDHAGPLPVADACEMIRQAAEGLAHAHAQGLVHRDIKPSNLVLTQDGTVKVLDFGLCRFSGSLPEDHADLTQSNQIMGTPDFMAPEQAKDARNVDARTDLYSLGCSLYFLLTGKSPFHGPEYATFFSKLLGHAKDPYLPLVSFRRDVPKQVEMLLCRLLAKDPASRPESALEVAKALAPFGQQADLRTALVRRNGAAPAAAGTKAARRLPRKRLVWVGLALPAAVLLVWLLAEPVRLALWGPAQPQVVQAKTPPAAQALAEWLPTTQAPPETRDAMLAVVKEPSTPRQESWAGESKDWGFALVARKALKAEFGQQAFRNAVHGLAVKELLSRKALLESFGDLGLTDHALLRKALEKAGGTLQLTGRTVGMVHETAQHQGWIVAYVAAPDKQVRAHLLTGTVKPVIVGHYQTEAHDHVRLLMKNKEWDKALQRILHLTQAKLTTPSLHLDAAQCFAEKGQAQNALDLLTKVLEQTKTTETVDFLYELGNRAFALHEKTRATEPKLAAAADALANAAYQAALDRDSKNSVLR